MRPAVSRRIAGNTEITLTIGNDVGPTSEKQVFEIDRVDYRITCAGTAPGSLPVPPDGSGGDDAHDDSVDISGQFEAMEPGNPPIWYVVTSLPPGPCTVTLLVTRNDEVVCSGDRTFTVSADEVTKLNIAMICSLSIALPDGSGENGGAFQFDMGMSVQSCSSSVLTLGFFLRTNSRRPSKRSHEILTGPAATTAIHRLAIHRIRQSARRALIWGS